MLCIGAKNYAQNVNIPDAGFKYYLVNNVAINTNGDSEIQVSEANAFAGTIDIIWSGISDLTGIEAFTQLTYLLCDDNQLTSLDLSNNTDLQYLDCSYNQLTSLTVSNNFALTYLICNNNQLTSLNVSNNIALIKLDCTFNPLGQLDVSNNIALTNLHCDLNQLNTLDVSNNTALIELSCSNNQLSSLDISNNSALTNLYCPANYLSSLDISNNSALTNLYCRANANLTCIQVWDTVYANNAWTAANQNIGHQMFFSLDCSNVSTAENLASSLSILPNPASDYLYISYEGEKKLSFAISDIWGKTLAAWETTFAGAFYQKEVPIADFSAGIYFLSAQAGDKKVVKKFVKE